ncbi:MAG: lanthionine synthetase C family protein [Pseudomonadota bacterium]
MSELFEPTRHVRIEAEWDQSRSEAFISTLFEATEERHASTGYWPAHPNDGRPPNDKFYMPFYLGIAGIAWAQKELERLGHGTLRNHYEEQLADCRELQTSVMMKGIPHPNKAEYLKGLLIAELGCVVAQIKFDQASESLKADALNLIEDNLENSVLELLWGSPGSLLVLASFLKQGLVGRENAGLFDRGLKYLESQLVTSPSTQAKLWDQFLYGEHAHILGAGHGFAGNSLAIIKAFPFLTETEREQWRQLIISTTKLTCVQAGGYVNWRQSIDNNREGRNAYLVQFCHGAPGVVICLAPLMGADPEFDEVLLKAGELTWDAGPLQKGPGFCHGTAGNGWAFLKLFEATREEKWLDRAKQFAAVSIKQAEATREATGDYRYSLWTGDVGVSLFLNAILTEDFEVPGFERF